MLPQLTAAQIAPLRATLCLWPPCPAQLDLLRQLRVSLCEASFTQHIDSIMQANLHIEIIGLCTHTLTKFSNAEPPSQLDLSIVYQCLWVLTNLAVDGRGLVGQLVAAGIVQCTEAVLMVDLGVGYAEIVECCLQLIGNIVGEDVLEIKMRYMKSEKFAMFMNNRAQALASLGAKYNETITWVISNLFRNLHKIMKNNQPQIAWLLGFYLPIMGRLTMYSLEHSPSLNNIHYALLQITHDWTQGNAIVHQIAMYMFTIGNAEVKMKAIEILGNMAANSDWGVKVIIENEAAMNFMLQNLKKIHPSHKEVQQMKSLAWILSNILAGTQEQTDFLLHNYSTFFNQMHEILSITKAVSVLRELVWAICNMIQSCSLWAFDMLYDSNILVCLSQNVIATFQKHSKEQKIALVFLEGMQSYVDRHQQNPEKYALNIEQKGKILQALLTIDKAVDTPQGRDKMRTVVQYLESMIVVGGMMGVSISG